MVLRFLTAGESHGEALSTIIEGIPAGFSMNLDFINNELARRQKGYGRGGRMAIETDKVRILSGVRLGVATGAPVAMLVYNKDWANWQIPMSVCPVEQNADNVEKIKEKEITNLRPGHADFAGSIKYNQSDVRNILERSSARETTTRVAVGAVAKSILKEFGIQGFSHVTQIGSAIANLDGVELDAEKIEASEVRCADSASAELMKKEIDEANAQGDTLGGSFEIIFKNLPVGLGSHVHWDKRLDGKIAQAIMSIPAVKSVEIGLGKDVAATAGSKTHDEIYYEDGKYTRKTNNAGGLEGGMTNGENIVVRASMKAIPTMKKPLNSVKLDSHEKIEAHFERSDTCAVPACAVVAESMLAIVLADAFLEKFGADNLEEIHVNYSNYCKALEKR